MNKIIKLPLIALGFCLVTLGIVFLTSRPAPAQVPLTSVPVKVTNTPLPVSLQGTTNLSGTVTVSNFPGLHPIQGPLVAVFNPQGNTTYTVPSPGPELVIDYVSGGCYLSPGLNAPAIQIQTTVGGNTIGSYLTMNGPFGNFYEFGQVTAVYADPGTTVSLVSPTINSTGGGNCTGSFSGHFAQ